MTISINRNTGDIQKIIKRYGHHKVITAPNFFYLEFKAGMNFQRLPNGKIVYYTVKRMY